MYYHEFDKCNPVVKMLLYCCYNVVTMLLPFNSGTTTYHAKFMDYGYLLSSIKPNLICISI
jgi:hypothetical protein